MKILDWAENKSTRIYDDGDWSNGANLTDEDEPMEGETLCMSLAQKDKNWCGEADAHAGWWISTTANIKVYGGGIDFPNNPSRSTVFGDSGSPIFRKWILSTVPSVPQRTPIGIVNAGSSDTPDEKEEHAIYFAKVQWALNNSAGWPNLEIYQGGQGSP